MNVKDNGSNDCTVEKEDLLPKERKKIHRGAAWDKRSWRSKDDKFHERVGAGIIKKERKHIETDTYAEVDALIDLINKFALSTTLVVAQLSITSRAADLFILQNAIASLVCN